LFRTGDFFGDFACGLGPDEGLAPDVIAGLAPWACRFGIELQQPLAA
jgi:hypothetical protein